MIKLNGNDYEWHEGMTVENLLKENKFTYRRIIVVINDKIIGAEDYASTVINDGDNVKAIHLMAGG